MTMDVFEKEMLTQKFIGNWIGCLFTRENMNMKRWTGQYSMTTMPKNLFVHVACKKKFKLVA
jgi:hypothetical protein